MISIKYVTSLAGGAVAHLGYCRALLLMRAMMVPIVARTIKICASLRIACSSTCLSPSYPKPTASCTIWNYRAPPVIYYTTKSTTNYKNRASILLDNYSVLCYTLFL